MGCGFKSSQLLPDVHSDSCHALQILTVPTINIEFIISWPISRTALHVLQLHFKERTYDLAWGCVVRYVLHSTAWGSRVGV